VNAWEVTREGRTRVEVTLRVGPRVLVARLTRAELARVSAVLDAAVAAENSGGYSRIRLGRAMREAIGRDPLASPGRDQTESFLPLWLAILYVVFGVGFAVRHLSGWLQLCGWALAAIAVADLVHRAVCRVRRRLR
jgi:hypothetical protein